MKTMPHNKEKAFTLIELMVVMMIIALLATLSAFGLQQTRESARDAQRRADLQTIKLALEQYRSDCNNYPATAGSLPSPFRAIAADCDTLTNIYIQQTPTDPTAGVSYYYAPLTAAPVYTYIICASLENGGDPADTTTCNNQSASCGSETCNFVVRNP
jgi:general secretion pathway protein G